MTETQPTAQQTQTDLIARFRDRYDELLQQAEVGKQHTDTEGWQSLYRDHFAASKVARRGEAIGLRSIADRLETYGLDEEGEKELAAIKKWSAEHRVAETVFEEQTVEPVRNIAEACRKCIFDFAQTAERDQDAAPLINSGLAKAMKSAIAEVPKVAWDAESGRVTISRP